MGSYQIFYAIAKDSENRDLTLVRLFTNSLNIQEHIFSTNTVLTVCSEYMPTHIRAKNTSTVRRGAFSNTRITFSYNTCMLNVSMTASDI